MIKYNKHEGIYLDNIPCSNLSVYEVTVKLTDNLKVENWRLKTDLDKLEENLIYIPQGMLRSFWNREGVYTEEQIKFSPFYISKEKVTLNLYREVIGRPYLNELKEDITYARLKGDSIYLFLINLRNITGKPYRIPNKKEYAYIRPMLGQTLDIGGERELLTTEELTHNTTPKYIRLLLEDHER